MLSVDSATNVTQRGAFIVDPLNHYLGRRGEIFLTACCLTATPIGSAFAQSWQGLFAARFVMGIGIGAKNATVPIVSPQYLTSCPVALTHTVLCGDGSSEGARRPGDVLAALGRGGFV